jgi:site-specific recombinase XerD
MYRKAPVSQALVRVGFDRLPAPIAAAGEQASWRFVEFFTANIRNANTRRAYGRAVGDFFGWCSRRHIRQLDQLNPTVIAAYVEQLGATHAKPSVKQHLAAVRMLFDWLIVGQVMPSNPASAVRGPAHVVKRGKTPVLSRDEARELLDAIETDSIGGLRDRALIGVMVYSFARIGAAIGLKLEDYYPQGKRWWLRLHEKGGKRHEVPVHHTLEIYLDAYIDTAGIREEMKGPLFRTLRRAPARPLSLTPLSQPEAWQMIRRRARAAGILTPIGCHTFRATGITAYLENGGTLEHAQQIAAHESPRTTKLYDRTNDQITLDEIERIVI